MKNILLAFIVLSFLLTYYAGSGRTDAAGQPGSSGTGPMSSIDSTDVSAVDAPTAPVSPSPDLIERAQTHLAQREYWASETDDGLQAPNRAHDLRSYFDARGVSVEDRDAPERTPLVGLSLVGLGREESLSRVPAGDVVDVGEGRVEIRRASIGLVEWFENSSAGLEQGFTLTKRPHPSSTKTSRGPSRGGESPSIESPTDELPSIETSAVEPTTGDELLVELSILGAHATLSGDRVRLATASGRSLDYGKLVVVDANEVALASRFEVPSEDRIRIVVDDREATYPIVIDPLLTGIFDAVVQSNLAGSEFGVSVASAGDVNGDGYDDVIVGATLYDQGETDEGAAFVFLGSPTGIGNGNPGSAHAVLEGNQPTSGFGRSVASAGDVNGDGYADVVVGAYLFEAGVGAGDSDEGAAFVFHGSATGIASGGPASSNGSMESNQASGFLGFGIASAGDVNGDGYGDLIVGAHGYDAPEVDEGAAFVLLGSATGIGNRNPTNADARLEGQQAGALFGLSVASAGDVDADGYSDVIVGAPYFDYIFPDTGSAYLFYGSASGIPSGDTDSTPSAFAGDQSFSRFGYSVASAGDVNGDGYADVIIGASFQDNVETDEGNAFVFHGSPTELSGGFFPTDANQRLESNQVLASFGTSVASAGDVNGDGYADVIVGAQFYDSGQIDEGLAFVYRGSATGVVPVAIPIQYDQTSAVLGYSVASAGDVNGDGFDDVVAGAFLADLGQADEGAAFVFHGGTASLRNGTLTDASSSIGALGGLGFSVASAGDVDADGHSDLVVGAPYFDAGQADEGAVFIFRGTPSGVPLGSLASASTSVYSDQVNALLGYQVASAGDVNGDGYGDVVAGAVQFDAGEVDEGAAFVFLGSASGIASGSVSTAHARLESNQAGALMGTGVSSAGDVDGDGYGDLLVGAGLYDAGSLDEGAVFVFSGSASGIPNGNPSTADATLESNQASTTAGSPIFGTSISSAGDVNGDGFDDVVIGAPGYENGSIFEGAAFLFLGSASGIDSGALSTADASFENDEAGSNLGLGVGSAGDVNGDGYSDIILGARAFESPIGIVAYVFHGGATGIPTGSPTTAEAQLALQVPTAQYAINVGSTGDLNADGYADVLVAASPTSGGLVGSIYAFLGSPSGVADATSASAHSSIEQIPASLTPYRTFAANAGDLNADGHPDLVVGTSVNGSVSVFLGNSQGRVVLARQFRGDGSGIAIQPGGATHAADAFEASVFVRSAIGRERGKVELETCPVGSPFGAPACRSQISPNWIDLGTTGAEIRQFVTGLAPNRSYSWRARLMTIPHSSAQPAITPLVHRSSWFRVQARANTGDLRTVPEPGGVVGLAVASVVLIVAGRERRRRRSGRSATLVDE